MGNAVNFTNIGNVTIGTLPSQSNVITMSPTTEYLLIAAVCFGIFSIVMSMVSKRNKKRQRTNWNIEQEKKKESERLKKSEENRKKFGDDLV